MTSTPQRKRTEEEEEEEQKTLCPNSLQLVLVLVLWGSLNIFSQRLIGSLLGKKNKTKTFCNSLHPSKSQKLGFGSTNFRKQKLLRKNMFNSQDHNIFCFSVSTSVLLGMFDRNTMHVSLQIYTSAYSTYYKHYHHVMFEKHIYMSTTPS